MRYTATDLKPSCDRYRTIKGVRYLNFLVSPSEVQIAACRRAKIRYRLLDGDLFIPEGQFGLARAAIPPEPWN